MVGLAFLVALLPLHVDGMVLNAKPQRSISTTDATLDATLPVSVLDLRKEQAGNTFEWDLCSVTTISNLGGLGPDSGPPELRYERVGCPGKYCIDLVVQNITPYAPHNSSRNYARGCFGVVNLALMSDVELQFTFVMHATDIPVTINEFYLSTFDLDCSSQGTEEVTFSAGWDDFYLSPTTELTMSGQSGTGGPITFTSTEYGTGVATPVTAEVTRAAPRGAMSAPGNFGGGGGMQSGGICGSSMGVGGLAARLAGAGAAAAGGPRPGGVQQAGVQSVGVQRPGMPNAAMPSHSPHSSGVPGPCMQHPGVPDPGMQNPGMHNPGGQSAGMHSHGVPSAGMPFAGAHGASLQSPTVQTPGMQIPSGENAGSPSVATAVPGGGMTPISGGGMYGGAVAYGGMPGAVNMAGMPLGNAMNMGFFGAGGMVHNGMMDPSMMAGAGVVGYGGMVPNGCMANGSLAAPGYAAPGGAFVVDTTNYANIGGVPGGMGASVPLASVSYGSTAPPAAPCGAYGQAPVVASAAAGAPGGGPVHQLALANSPAVGAVGAYGQTMPSVADGQQAAGGCIPGGASAVAFRAEGQPAVVADSAAQAGNANAANVGNMSSAPTGQAVDIPIGGAQQAVAVGPQADTGVPGAQTAVGAMPDVSATSMADGTVPGVAAAQPVAPGVATAQPVAPGVATAQPAAQPAVTAQSKPPEPASEELGANLLAIAEADLAGGRRAPIPPATPAPSTTSPTAQGNGGATASDPLDLFSEQPSGGGNAPTNVPSPAAPRGFSDGPPPADAAPSAGPGFGAPEQLPSAQLQPFPAPQAQAMQVPGQQLDRLFVQKVPSAATRDDIRVYFSNFGAVTDVFLPVVLGTTQHKGIAFISYADVASLQRALAHAPHELLGQPVTVDVAIPRPGTPGQPAPMPGTGVPVGGRLFVTKVALDVTVVDLRNYFGQFGPLADVYVPPGGKSIAFVSFADPASAARVLQSPSHEVKLGRVVVVDQAIDRPPMGAKGKGKGGVAPAQFPPMPGGLMPVGQGVRAAPY